MLENGPTMIPESRPLIRPLFWKKFGGKKTQYETPVHINVGFLVFFVGDPEFKQLYKLPAPFFAWLKSSA